MGNAIVQRPNYENADANLPFYISVGLAVALATICALNADLIAQWLGVADVEQIIVALAVIAPFSTITLFQDVHYLRAFAYRKLAMRFFLANIAAGILAIAAAISGWGAWSLVVQIYASTLISLIWLWVRPLWWPGFTLRFEAFRQLTAFALPVLSMQLLDFIAVRLFEVTLLSRYGVAVFGLYTIGSRIFQTLMQLLQSALNNISLSVLSRISHDKIRMARIYRQVIFLSSIVFIPIFVGSAIFIHFIVMLLFGNEWIGAENIARSFLLLGAVQSVQFINGCYLAALGQSFRVFCISAIKNVTMICVAVWTNNVDVEHFVAFYALSQLVSTPFSFILTCRELKIRFLEIAFLLFPAITAVTVAALAMYEISNLLQQTTIIPLLQTVLLILLFGIAYLFILFLTGFQQIINVKEFFVQRLGRSKYSNFTNY